MLSSGKFLDYLNDCQLTGESRNLRGKTVVLVLAVHGFKHVFKHVLMSLSYFLHVAYIQKFTKIHDLVCHEVLVYIF
jgi:hypothetical protein